MTCHDLRLRLRLRLAGELAEIRAPALRLASKLAEIRAPALRFSEPETRSAAGGGGHRPVRGRGGAVGSAD